MNSPALHSSFQIASKSKTNKPKQPPRLSVRLSWGEWDQLKAGMRKSRLAQSAYVRLKLFDEKVSGRKKRYLRKQRQPNMDYKEIARLLSMLGQSELAPSLIAIAYAAKSGALPVTPHLLERLDKCCADIEFMRLSLIVALGIKAEPCP